MTKQKQKTKICSNHRPFNAEAAFQADVSCKDCAFFSAKNCAKNLAKQMFDKTI